MAELLVKEFEETSSGLADEDEDTSGLSTML
jgi:hypothetical protein